MKLKIFGPTEFKITLIYRGGAKHSFWCTKFKYAKIDVESEYHAPTSEISHIEWDDSASVNNKPLCIGRADIVAIFQDEIRICLLDRIKMMLKMI